MSASRAAQASEARLLIVKSNSEHNLYFIRRLFNNVEEGFKHANDQNINKQISLIKLDKCWVLRNFLTSFSRIQSVLL